MTLRTPHTLLLCIFLLGLTSCDRFSLGRGGYTPVDTEKIEGSFDAETRYDMQTLAGALKGSVSPWEDPDSAIQRAIVDTVRKNYNNQVAVGVAELYGGWISQEINAHLNSVAPAWVRALPSSLSIVDQQLEMVDVQSSILLARQEDGSYKATQIWNGLSVFRTPECRKNGGLKCEQINISFQELLDAEYPIELVSSDFAANVDTTNTLSMKSHEIKFNYGRLALYLMTNLVLPDEPGAGLQLRDVLLAAINCRGLAGRLAGDDKVLGWNIGGVQVGLSVNDLVGSCQEGVFSMINGFVDQFHVPLSMNLAGKIQLIDTDRDTIFDQLAAERIAGDLNATLLSGQTHEGPVDAQMTGWRVGNTPKTGTDSNGDDGSDTIDDGTTIWSDGS